MICRNWFSQKHVPSTGRCRTCHRPIRKLVALRLACLDSVPIRPSSAAIAFGPQGSSGAVGHISQEMRQGGGLGDTKGESECVLILRTTSPRFPDANIRRCDPEARLQRFQLPLQGTTCRPQLRALHSLLRRNSWARSVTFSTLVHALCIRLVKCCRDLPPAS